MKIYRVLRNGQPHGKPQYRTIGHARSAVKNRDRQWNKDKRMWEPWPPGTWQIQSAEVSEWKDEA